MYTGTHNRFIIYYQLITKSDNKKKKKINLPTKNHNRKVKL